MRYSFKTILFTVFSIACFTVFSCGSAHQISKFSSSSIEIGTSKESVLATYGSPMKSEFWENDSTGSFEERLYYKETFAGKAFESPYTITNILLFVDGKLKSLKQGPERSLNEGRRRQTEEK